MIEEIKIISLSGRGSVVMRARDYQGYWLGPVDWGQVEGQHQTYSYYNQIGESIVSTTVPTRPLSVTGWIVDGGDGTFQQRCDFLNAFFTPKEDYDLEYNGKKIRFRPNRSIVYSPEYTKNNERCRRFLLQATCPYPLFTDLEDTRVPFDVTHKLFRFPTDWGRNTQLVFAATNKAYSIEVENLGSFETGILAEIRFSGEVQNPRIKNLTTDKFIGVNRAFRAGERLEFSTIPGGKYIRMYAADGGEINLIRYRDYQMSWITLTTGPNLLALDCDDLDQRGNMAAALYYTPLYLEVQ